MLGAHKPEEGMPDSSSLSWIQQFIIYFRHAYEDLRDLDEHNILKLHEEKLTQDFPQMFDKIYNDLVERLPIPDRHKYISLLTKAFLDVSPFSSDIMRAQELSDSDKLLRTLLFPNEVLAVDICMIMLRNYGRYFQKSENYNFEYPNNVYVFLNRKVKTDYEFELFVLYRHYINRQKQGKGHFSIYQMAHTYFLLEMGCDISKYNMSSKYYNI